MVETSSKIEIASLADECHKRIKHDILVGKLGWGDRLNVINLAETFGISRSPVVKAIDRLAMEQLVKIIPNKGSFVLIPAQHDVIEVSEIRLMLETTLCRLSFKKNKDELIAEISKLNQYIRDKYNDEPDLNFETFLNYDRNFHLSFSKFSNNNRLSTYYSSIRSQIELFRTKTYKDRNVVHALDLHHKIQKELEKDRIESALALLETHIIDVENETLESIESESADLIYK